jgi:ferrous iron transport protein A
MFGSVIARLQGPSSFEADPAPTLRERACATGLEVAGAAPAADTREMVPLTRLARHATGIVAGVRLSPPGSAAASDPALERMALRLIEIGFVQGERLRVVAFGQPGDDPIGVRIGGRGGSSTFALRRQEAGCVWVWPDR